MDSAQQQERLVAICERICVERAETDEITTYEIDHADDPTARPVAVVHGMYDHANIRFSTDQTAMLVRIDTEDPHPGDVMSMTLRAAVYPEGDFQVADVIADQLS